MPFSADEKINSSDKLTQQIVGTANTTPGEQFWFNESFGWMPITTPARVWTDFDSIPGANTPAEANAAVAANPSLLESRKSRLTLRLESNDRAYLSRTTFDDNTTPTFENWVQPSLIQNNGGASNGYIVRLFHGDPDAGGVEITTTQHGGTDGSPAWQWNYAFGLLLVSTDQRSTFKSYYDGNGLWLEGYRYIGPTGSGAGQAIATQEVINMVADPVGGVSPSADTVITTQAEYDALGDDLLYIQDVFDILAHSLGRPAFLTLKAGTYTYKPGASGIPGFEMTFAMGWGRDLAAGASPFDGSSTAGNGAIIITGESSIILDVEQPGTSTATTVVRGSGTWVVHEHRGDYVLIKTGAGAGSRVLIEDNDASTLYLRSGLSSYGVVTFEIVEPAAVVNSPTYYTGPIYAGAAPIEFRWVKLGTETSLQGSLLLAGNVNFVECQLHVRDIMTLGGFTLVSEVNLRQCFIRGALVPQEKSVRMYLQGSVLQTYSGMTAKMIEIVFDGTLVLRGSSLFVLEGSGYSQNMIEVDFSTLRIEELTVASLSKLHGDGTAARGIYLPPGSKFITVPSGTLDINNCGVALDCSTEQPVHLLALTGTGNTTGIKVSKGAALIMPDLSGLGATNEIDIDGQVIDYSELANEGDKITGPYGSSILRR